MASSEDLSREGLSHSNDEKGFKIILSGDGLTIETAAIPNCASLGMAKAIIDDFISKKHGQKNVDWTPSFEYFINGENIPEFTIRAYCINLKEGNGVTYYFNICRQEKNAILLGKLRGEIPRDL